jgi:hypothetical protein
LVPHFFPVTNEDIIHHAIKRLIKHTVARTRRVHDLRLKLWLKSTHLGLMVQASLKLWESYHLNWD